MNFERGKDPRSTMGIGLEPKLDKLIEESIDKHSFNMCNGSIREEQRIEIEKELGVPVGLEVRDTDDGEYILTVTCSKIGYKKEFNIHEFAWPVFQKVAAKTMAGDLVPVQPLPSPKGELFYLDYTYGRNRFQIVLDKVKNVFRKR